MEKNYLWKFYWDCGRSGELDGLFVATEEGIKHAIGKTAYFGEVLGKHSEVYGIINERDIWKVDLDSETVEKVSEILGEIWNGFNPLNYIQYECPICEESYFRYDEFNHETKTCYDCEEKQNEKNETRNI